MYVVEDLFFDHIFVVQDSTGTIYNYGPNDVAKKIAQSLQEYLFPGVSENDNLTVKEDNSQKDK